MPPQKGKARLIAEVSALGYNLDGLAAASETAWVYPREFEAIEGDLQRRGFFLTPEITQAIAGAFLADAMARAPAPRSRVASGSQGEIDGKSVRPLAHDSI